MPTERAYLFLQMLIVVPRIEQDIDVTTLGQVGRDLVQHLSDEHGEFVKSQFRFAGASAIELFDKLVRQIESPRQHELDGTQLQSERGIARTVGEVPFLTPRLTMIVVQCDRFEGTGRHILWTQAIVDPQEEPAPAGALLNLDDGLQEKQGQGFLDRCTLPGTGAKKIGGRKFVGMGQAQQTRERAQRLVLAGTDHERFDAIQRVTQLGG